MSEWLCAACNDGNPDGTRFCGHCGARRKAGIDRGEERRLVTAVFADLSGFTTLMQTGDPETVAAVIDPLVASLSDTVASLGGTVEKYAGDAVLAVFGAPIAHEDDAARALRAAMRMHGIVARYPESQGQPLTLHVGVDSGWTIVRSFGGAGREDYGALGTAIITAQRLESQAPPEETFVGDVTHTLTARAFEFEPLAPMTLKGIVEPVAAWRLLKEGDSDEATTELVGRRREMAELTNDLEVAAQGVGRVRTLRGDPGVGKSRMVKELSRSADDAGFTVLTVNFVDDAKRPYQGWLDAFSVLLADRSDLIEALVGTTSEPLDPELLHAGLRTSGLNGLARAASDSPVLLVVEDLHWSPSIDLDLLSYLAGRISGLAVLILATSRRGPDVLSEKVPEVRTLEIDVLDDEAIAALAREVVGAPLESKSAAALAHYCGGNPLFCHQMLLSMSERGDLIGEAELRFVSTDVLADLPPTVEGLMAARLDLLPPEAAQLASVMAVAGLAVSRRLLRELEGQALHGDLDSSLDALAAQGFVTDVSQPVVRFAHALIRQAAENRLTSRSRAETHALLADAAFAVYGETDEGIVLRAQHLANAGDVERAVPALRRASEVQRRVFANDQAMTLLEQAVGLATGDGEDPPADLLLEAADQAEFLGRYEQALAWYERAGDLLPAWVGRAEVLRKTGRFDQAREVAAAGLDLFSDHPTASAALLLQDGHARLSAGEYAEAAEVLAAALRQAPVSGTLRTTIEVHLADALATLGRMEEALTYGESALASASAASEQSPRLAVTVARGLGGVLQDADRWNEAADTLRQGLELARRLGDVEEQGACLINLGLSDLHFERYEGAVASFEEAISLFEEIGHATGCLVGYGNLAQALGTLGRTTEALTWVERAERLASELGDQISTLDVSLTRAELLLDVGMAREAIAVADKAADAFRSLGMPTQMQRAVELAARARSG